MTPSPEDMIEVMEQCDAHGYVYAYCSDCNVERNVEPDAEGYDCHEPGCGGKVTSPLVIWGLI
jgi:hypothetical protein